MTATTGGAPTTAAGVVEPATPAPADRALRRAAALLLVITGALPLFVIALAVTLWRGGRTATASPAPTLPLQGRLSRRPRAAR